MQRLLIIGTDTMIFDEGSQVRERQVQYAKNTIETHIIVLTKKGSAPKEAALSPNCFAYSTDSLAKMLSVMGAIRLGKFLIERRKIDYISCQDPFFTGMVGVSLKKRFHIPLELQIHTDIGSPKYSYNLGNRIRRALALSYLRYADKVRVVSNKVRDFVLRLNIPGQNIEMRPIAVDQEYFMNAQVVSSLKTKFPQFSKIVLMASRLEKEKNIEMAVMAWKFVLEKIPQAGLVIVGQGSRKDLLSTIADRLGISSSVVFEPWAPKSTLASYYKTADLFLNTSLFEGYGMTLVEAKAAGCKIVSTDVGVAKEIGATIADWDPADISQKIISQIQ